MIELMGKHYHTLKDEIYVNGAKVVEAYADGAKVYPDKVRVITSASVSGTDYYENTGFMTFHVGDPKEEGYSSSLADNRRYINRLRFDGLDVKINPPFRYGDFNMGIDYSMKYERRYYGDIELTIDCDSDDIFFYEPNEDDRKTRTSYYYNRRVFQQHNGDDRPKRHDYSMQPYLTSDKDSRVSYNTYDYLRTFPCVDVERPLHIRITGTASCDADFHDPDVWTGSPIRATQDTKSWMTWYHWGNPQNIDVDMVCTLKDYELDRSIFRQSDNWSSDWRDDWVRNFDHCFLINDNVILCPNSLVSIERNGRTYAPITDVVILADPSLPYGGGTYPYIDIHTGAIYPFYPGSIRCIFSLENGYDVEYYC